MKKKFAIFFLALLSVCMFTVTACDTNNGDYSNNPSTNSSESSTTTENVFCEDIVINRFITEFNGKSGYAFSNIQKGNIKTKYYAYANECYVEMVNATNAFYITIDGGKEIVDRNRMFNVFKQVVKTLDSNATDSQIVTAIEYLESQKYMVTDYKITDSVTVETYKPISETSYGKTACRIDVISNNYK